VTGASLHRRPGRTGSGPVLAGLLAITLSAASDPPAADPPAADRAEAVQALAERAAAHVEAVGLAEALADFTRADGGFVEGELYVFCNGADGTVLAHGGNPKLVGKTLAALRDGEERLPIAEVTRLGLTQGRGWLEYLWPNPVTRRIQRKISFVVRIDDRTVCGSGYYRPDSP